MQVSGLAPARSRWHGAALLACASATSLQLLLLSRQGPDLRSIGVLVMVASALALPLWLAHKRWPHAAAAMTATGALGGLGMLVGTLLDQRWGTNALPPCHARAAPLTSASMLTWMNGLMLLVCVPACVWLSPHCWRRRSIWLRHALGIGTMFLGMTLGGRWLAPRLDGTLTALAANHVGMTLGMMLGAALAHFPVRAARKPIAVSDPSSDEPGADGR